jgi:predicted Zn-dependent protease
MIDCMGVGVTGRPSRTVRAIALATTLALSASGAPAIAQTGTPGGDGQKLPFIRDAEIEQLLRDYTTPILRAAGLAQQNVQVVGQADDIASFKPPKSPGSLR